MRFTAHLCAAPIAIALLASSLAAQTPTIVFLVRHAETATTPANDPLLSDAGKARAAALAHTLSNAGIAAILASQQARARGTAEPLASKLALDITAVPAGPSPPAAAQSVVDIIRKLTGKAILVVGDANTVNVIATALGAPKLPDLCAGDYDQLFILELMPTGPPRFVKTRYGARATDAACEAMR
jgi:phosphohistidine phosphatase SixA